MFRFKYTYTMECNDNGVVAQRGDHVTDIKTFHNSVLCSNQTILKALLKHWSIYHSYEYFLTQDDLIYNTNQTMVSYNIVDSTFDGEIAYHDTYEHFYIKLK